MTFRQMLNRVFSVLVLLVSLPVSAQVLSLAGNLDVITDNTGQSMFSSAVQGDALRIDIDATTADGFVSVAGGAPFAFDCCIAAGGVDAVNDLELDVETALTFNTLLGVNQFSAGDTVDILQVEGDQLTPTGSRIEAGVTFILAGSAIVEGEQYVLNTDDILLSIGFVLEEFMNVDTFSAVGVVSVDTDTDGDGTLDTQDNCTLAANPSQLDSDGDGIGNACDPDVDNNCVVNFLDFVFFPPAFGAQAGDPEFDINMDFNEDGSVGFLDLSVIANYFGLPPGPANQACVAF